MPLSFSWCNGCLTSFFSCLLLQSTLLLCSKNSINLSVAAFYSLKSMSALLWEMQVLQGGDEAVTALLKTQLHVQSFLRMDFGGAQGRAACGNNKCASVSSVYGRQSWLLLVVALIQVRFSRGMWWWKTGDCSLWFINVLSPPFFMKWKENNLCILNLLFKPNLLNTHLTLIAEINHLSTDGTTWNLWTTLLIKVIKTSFYPLLSSG